MITLSPHFPRTEAEAALPAEVPKQEEKKSYAKKWKQKQFHRIPVSNVSKSPEKRYKCLTMCSSVQLILFLKQDYYDSQFDYEIKKEIDPGVNNKI